MSPNQSAFPLHPEAKDFGFTAREHIAIQMHAAILSNSSVANALQRMKDAVSTDEDRAEIELVIFPAAVAMTAAAHADALIAELNKETVP